MANTAHVQWDSDKCRFRTWTSPSNPPALQLRNVASSQTRKVCSLSDTQDPSFQRHFGSKLLGLRIRQSGLALEMFPTQTGHESLTRSRNKHS